jgi:hypothetical protein
MKKIFIIIVHALIGWGICGAIIGIGRNITSMDNTLIIHAIGAPLVFAIISFIYHKIFNYTKPIQTALIFMGFAMLLDAGLVAPFIEKSFDMFKSIIGTWIPFACIFLTTCVVGELTVKTAK